MDLKMTNYIGVKQIKAESMTLSDYNKAFDRVIPATKGEAGYLVEYEDGYKSWSPKEVFEKAYRLTDGLTYGLALEALKLGKKVARIGWNGKGMFIYLVDESNPVISELRGACEKHVLPTISDLTTCYDECLTIRAHVDMKMADGSVMIEWTPNSADQLAEDWIILK